MTDATLDIKKKKYLMWFRRDLRLTDNTALSVLFDEAHQYATQNPTVSAVYTVTPKQWLEHDMSLVQMDFIFRTLRQLAESLYHQLNVVLDIIVCNTFADSVARISDYCHSNQITDIYTNIEYEVNEQTRDEQLNKLLTQQDIEFHRYHDQCILPPHTVTTNDNTMYKVFTPFYKKWQTILHASPVQPYDAPITLNPLNENAKKSKINKQLDSLLSDLKNSYEQTLERFKEHYDYPQSKVDELLSHTKQDYLAGEDQALERLTNFVSEDINDYNITRDQPALMATSQLSAYLTIGAISARQCYKQAQNKLSNMIDEQDAENDNSDKEVDEDERNNTDTHSIERWISELAWRDFYRHGIADRPDLVMGHAYKRETDKKVDWSYDSQDFKKWCEGLTGVPLVDAAMRCLNQTGFMHNRLRMVTAMFLTKDLLIDWRLGERYFMQNLIDGDFASNNGGWQWSASVGTDASPYFRIMNPFSQAKTHDKDAIFIKTWLPELKTTSAKILHDENRLRKALDSRDFCDTDYPKPMVEHKQARLNAIAEFKKD